MSYGPQSPKSNIPNPYAIVAISLLSFGSFVYLVKKREQEAKLIPASEKRRQFENPLIPPRHREDPIVDTK